MYLARRKILALSAAVPAALIAGTTPVAARSVGATVSPAPSIPVEPDDTAEQIIAKAVRVVPTETQLAWQRRELTVFTHFGMNTFTGREWGSGAENPAWFAPERLDIEQWMRAYQAAGARLVMLTAKHHDGFVLYPSRYTDHSVRASPWNGDVLESYVRAARRAGMRVGVYLSPADGAELPHAWHARWVERIRAKQEAGEPLTEMERVTLADGDRAPGGHGRYGNGSEPTKRTIPTPVDGDDRTGAVAGSQPSTFEVTVDDYNAYYLNQVYELCTQYGPIDELWLDGANPWSDSGISQDYDFQTIYDVVATLSPETLIFKAPRGIRWIGNEDGIARESEWSVIPIAGDEINMRIPGGESATDLGSRERLTNNPEVSSLHWFPGEADVSIREGWFHHADEHPKSAGELVELYEKSVGRNAVLLLNVPPSKAGTVDDADIGALTAFRRALDDTYRVNLLAGGPGDVVAALTDGRLSTGWSPSGGTSTGSVVLRLPKPAKFDRIRIGENVTRGQRVEGFAIDAWDDGWREVASATTIGYSRILVLASPVTTDRIRLRVTAARAIPHVATLGLHLGVNPG